MEKGIEDKSKIEEAERRDMGTRQGRNKKEGEVHAWMQFLQIKIERNKGE